MFISLIITIVTSAYLKHMVRTDPNTCVFKINIWTILILSLLGGFIISILGINSPDIFGTIIIAITGLVFYVNRRYYMVRQEYVISD